LPSSPWPYSSARPPPAGTSRGITQRNGAAYVLPGFCIGRSSAPRAKPLPTAQPAFSRKHGTLTVPSTTRAISGSVAGVSSSRVIVNAGDLPSGSRSRRSRSPSAANARSRMCSIGPVVDARLATVKSHASTRPRRATPARSSARNTLRIAGRRALIALEFVRRLSRSARNANVGLIALPPAVFNRRSATT
jgi:hypothetical protein